MDKTGEVLLVGIFGIVVVIGILAIGSFITQWAWNVFFVEVLHLPSVTLIQAFALNVLVFVARGLDLSVFNKKK